MSIGEICTRHVVCVRRDSTVKAAAQLMREHHVGDVIVVEESSDKRIPTGIVTDRDIAVAVVALELDPAVIQVGDLVSGTLVTAGENWDVSEVVELMQLRNFRRIVVIDAHGYLAGIISADDVLSVLAEEMTNLAQIVGGARKREAVLRKVLV